MLDMILVHVGYFAFILAYISNALVDLAQLAFSSKITFQTFQAFLVNHLKGLIVKSAAARFEILNTLRIVGRRRSETTESIKNGKKTDKRDSNLEKVGR